MSLKSIPTSDDPFYRQVTALEGTDYVLTFNYNQRENVYYLTVSTADDVDIVRGIKLVCKWHLFAGHIDTRLPPGILMVLPRTTDDSPPGLGELGAGKRCELVYLEVNA
jgi:hypothetical protein